MEGHFKIFSALLLILFFVPTVAVADVGDMESDVGDMGFDASDLGMDMASDSGMDMASDAGMDMAPDAQLDVGADDAGMPDQGMQDAGSDASTDAGTDMPFLVTFSGTVTLRPDGIGSVTILLNGDNGERFQQQIFSGDTFLIEGIPAGDYQVRVSSTGYQTIDETIELATNTGRNFELFLSASALVMVDITVDAEFPPPQTEEEEAQGDVVIVKGTSARDTFTEAVPITDQMGEFTRELGVETWQLEFSAQGFQPVTQEVDVSTSRESTALSVRLYRDRVADVRVNENCSCKIAGSSRTPATLVVCGMMLGLVFWRRKRAQENT